MPRVPGEATAPVGSLLPRPYHSTMTMFRSVALTSLLAFGLAGCVGAGTPSEQGEPSLVASEELSLDRSEESFVSEPSGMDAQVEFGNSIITSGHLYLTVDDPPAAADSVEQIVSEVGGRVDSRSDVAEIDGEEPSSYLWVRIPAEDLETTLATISELGTVENRSITNQDVSLQVVDLEARIEVLRNSIDRLEALLEEATSTSELVDIETGLSDRQAELESMLSQRNFLTDQVEFASVGIDLRTDEVAPDREPDGFVDGILAGWDGMLAFLAGTVVFFGALVPWVGLIGALVAVIALVAWLRRRNR